MFMFWTYIDVEEQGSKNRKLIMSVQWWLEEGVTLLTESSLPL